MSAFINLQERHVKNENESVLKNVFEMIDMAVIANTYVTYICNG